MYSNLKSQLNLEIVDTIFDPEIYGINLAKIEENEKYKVYYKEGEPALYKVWLFLKGNDLPFVEYVTYHLHESFPDPVINVERSISNPECRTFIWTWGIFEITAEIFDQNGNAYRLQHQMTYGDKLREFEDKIEYKEGNPDASTSGATLI